MPIPKLFWKKWVKCKIWWVLICQITVQANYCSLHILGDGGSSKLDTIIGWSSDILLHLRHNEKDRRLCEWVLWLRQWPNAWIDFEKVLQTSFLAKSSVEFVRGQSSLTRFEMAAFLILLKNDIYWMAYYFCRPKPITTI